MHAVVAKVARRIIERSRDRRAAYLERMEATAIESRGVPFRMRLPCSNLAHNLAGCIGKQRTALLAGNGPSIGIVSAYNDLVSAHQPLGRFPKLIRQAVAEAGGAAQFAGGTPAMCDGITQGEPGMELSLISRDVIAMSVVVALSHNVFDGVLLLGVCDKIMPGLLVGGLQYGHLPMLLVPAGPMATGMGNQEKNRIRERFAKGEVGRDELLASEMRTYHSPGTCTFYGTANSNQLIAELLGVQLPGASFVNAETELRDALTMAAACRVAAITHLGSEHVPLARVVSEKAVVNAMVGLLATGGSTNETMHLVAIARAAGIIVNWDDFAVLSSAVPLIARIYPNGPSDVNAFQQAGGTALLFRELLGGGMLHEDVQTVVGHGLDEYLKQPELVDGRAIWRPGPELSRDSSVLAPLSKPFAPSGGIKVLTGNLGRAIMKTSALAAGEDAVVEAPAMVFDSQQELEQAFREGRMNRDLVAVVRFQGPRANGMPELHKLITPLSVLMEQGLKVGLVTDGRLSGASGKVPFAIHCTPEAMDGGLLAKVQDGDVICMDARSSLLELKTDAAELASRKAAHLSAAANAAPGLQIFAAMRRMLSSAEEGASAIV